MVTCAQYISLIVFEALPFSKSMSWQGVFLGILGAQEPGERRFNMAFELRPRCNVWHPWRKMLDAVETAPETEP